MATAIGGVEAEEVQQRVMEGSIVLVLMISFLKGRTLSFGVHKTICQQVTIPTVNYGAETLGLREAERLRLNVFVMRCLRPTVGVARWDRETRRSVGGQG